jgi:alkaline phosphatase D
MLGPRLRALALVSVTAAALISCDDGGSDAVAADAEVADSGAPGDATGPRRDAATLDGGTLDDGGAALDTGPGAPAPDAAPPRVGLDAPATASACETIRVVPRLDGDADSLSWTLEGLPLLSRTLDGDGALEIRAPVANRPITIVVGLAATLDGVVETATAEIEVAATPPGDGMAPGTALDCAPFVHGVASGDPTPDSVLLWTRRASDGDAPVTLSWTVARDPALTDVVAEGTVDTDPAADHTAMVEVADLAPATTYYYGFEDPDGAPSALGRTRTAPRGEVDRVRFASMSCSSLFSGWFNAYARLAERDDLDLVIHLGDYIYDFVDPEEEVRLFDPYPIDPDTEAEWRTRHQDYLSDPDLRRARAAHPWFVLWDNHDVASEPAQNTFEVFRDYVPMRRRVPEDARIGYRMLRYGDLVEFYLIDALNFREAGDEETPRDLLGAAQWSWLDGVLDESTAAWRIIGSQKLVTTLSYPGGGLPDPTPWDDYPETRARLFERLDAFGDNMMLSGDLHFAIANDLVADPEGYDPATSTDSVGVELLAAGVTRGNFDETICGGLCSTAAQRSIENIRTLLGNLNPHNAFLELIQHGYGVVEVDAEGVTAQLWFSVIRESSTEEVLGGEVFAPTGARRWSR